MSIDSVEIFGSSGYLGSFISSRFPEWYLPSRQDLPSRKYSLDCSFPKNYLDDKVFMDFKLLLMRRVKHCNLLGSKYVYIGSISSKPPIVSKYGRRKMEIESIVIQNGQIVVNLGLVISDLNPGGRYLSLRKTIEKLPIVPTPHEDTFELYCHQLEELSQIDSFISGIQGGRQYLFDNLIRSNLGSVASRIAKDFGKKEIKLSKTISRALELLMANSPTSALDSLKSLTVKRRMDYLDQS